MPGLDPKVAVHRLNIKEGAKPVKQPQRRFRPDIMDAIEQEVQKLIDSGFIREEQHQIGSQISSPSLKRTDQSASASTSATSTTHVRRMSSRCPSPISWWTTPPAMRGCPSWMDSPGTIKSKCTRMTRGTPPLGHLLGYSATQSCPLD